MIFANFNRSSGYFLIFMLLIMTGCAEQSANHLAIDKAIAPEKVASTQQEPLPETLTDPQYPLTFQPTIAWEQPTINKEQPTEQVAVAPKTVIRQTVREKETAKRAKEISTATSYAIAMTAVARHTKNLWGKMFSMYALPEVDNPRVTQEIEKFLKHPKGLLAIQRRAEPYLYLILDELKSKKLPGELALLPIIESAYQVNAQSGAEAAGLWQFTPATATTFGLKQNWWYDGRRDVTASTEAATSYLKKLHKKFDGDWFLALASYNVGAGNVQKAIRKNTGQSLETDFWALDLPEETKAYVPKLLALAKIFAHSDEYKLPLHPIPNQPLLRAINISSQLDLSKAAELAGMPEDEFFNLNPAFNHAITAPDGEYKILVKAKNAAAFKKKLAKLPKSEHVKWGAHTIKAGEDLDVIAKLHDIPVEALMEINQLKDQKLAVGGVLRLPPVKALKVASKV